MGIVGFLTCFLVHQLTHPISLEDLEVFDDGFGKDVIKPI